jgi:hypothetical protein
VSFSGCVYRSVRSIRFVVGIWAVGFALVCVLADNPVCEVVWLWNRAAMSICYCTMVVTSLVGFVVVVAVSSCSI